MSPYCLQGSRRWRVLCAGAVVTQDVASYSVAAARLAHIDRQRFDAPIVSRLQAFALDRQKMLCGTLGDFGHLTVEAFLEKYRG
jgi:hypothetical protein